MKITETEYNLKLALEEIEELKQAAERTPRECEIIYFALSRLLDETINQNEFNEIDTLRDKFKTPNNQLNQKNPSGPDECKSVQ